MRHSATILLSGWVLWVNSGYGDEFALGKTKWSVNEAYESRSDCIKARTTLMQEVLKSLVDLGEEAHVSGQSLTSTSQDGRPHIVQYYCLPAEVDPRPR